MTGYLPTILFLFVEETAEKAFGFWFLDGLGLFWLFQHDEFLDVVVVCDRFAFDDVFYSLLDDFKGHDEPFLGFCDAGIDLELDVIEESVNNVFEGGGLDVVDLPGCHDLHWSEEVGGFVGGVCYALLDCLAGEAYLV